MTRSARVAGCVLAALLVAGFGRGYAQGFTPGDLVVTTYGNVGNAATNNTYTDGQPTPISLLEFSTLGGAPIWTLTLPTVDNGANLGIVGEYGSSSEGTIQLSDDGQYLTFGGYSATPSYAGNYSIATTALAQSTDVAVPRVFALVDANGNVNTSTVLNNVYSTNNPRSVYMSNGSLYLSGQGSGTSDQGIYRVPVGMNSVSNPGATPTPIYNTLDTRTAQVYGGNLYYSQDKKNKATGIFEFSGTPTGLSTATQIIPGSNGLSGSAKVNYSPQGFFFADSNTLYVADTGLPKNGGTSDGGIQKWTFNGSIWTLQYTLTDPDFVLPTLTATATHGETGFEALTGRLVDGTVELFAVSYTAADADPNGLYAITDTLSATTSTGETFTKLESSGVDNVFKGVSFAPVATPEPSSIAMLLVAGGAGFVFVLRKRRAAL